MWKSQDFPVTQILREINLMDFKTAILTILAVLNFWGFLHISKWEI